MKIHRFKVQATYYEHHLNKQHRPPPVPAVSLQGYWLSAVGFEVGKRLKVLPGKDHLVLILEQDETT